MAIIRYLSRKITPKCWQRHFTTRLSGYFLVFSLISVVITSGVTFYQAQTALQKSVFDQLNAVATLKENEISRWFEDQERIFLAIAQLPIVTSQSRLLLDAQANTRDRSDAKETLVKYLTSIKDQHGSFMEVSILDRSDRIIVSTQQLREGEYESSADLTYFETVKPGQATTPIFYHSPVLGRLIVTFATPLQGKQGERIGVMATHLNLERLTQIVKAQRDLGTAVDAYLVGSVGVTNTLVTQTLRNTPIGKAVTSIGIEQAKRGINGAGLYKNYRHLSVIGVYHNLTNVGLSLLVEQRQDIADLPAKKLAQQIMWMGIISAGILSLGLYWLARLVVSPILAIADTAKQVAAGNLLQRAPVMTTDEVGLLARHFNYMVEQLQLSLQQSEMYSSSLEQQAQKLQRALEEISSTQAQLVQSEKMSALGNLVAGVAHEMNNPLGFIFATLHQTKPTIADITAHLQLYQTFLPDPCVEIFDHAQDIDLDYSLEELPKMIDGMIMACERLENISTSLRTFSRADQDHKVPFDIHTGIDSTILILKHRLKANDKRPAIEVVTDYGNLPQVDCYPGQLNQVFMNILANAIDALEEANLGRSFAEIKANPNRITIRTSVNPYGIKISIGDNGQGMSKEIQQKIFEHLFTTKEVGKGTGLGLAIAQQIITETHGGHLSCHSVLGQGTEFIIEIPI